MATQMTREEYQKKYGVPPGVLTPQGREMASAMENAQNPFAGFAKGVGKSALNTVQGLGQIGRKIQDAIAPGDFGMGKNSPFDPSSEAGKRLEKIATPNTTAEKVGAFAGDVAQFAIPGGAASKVTKGGKIAKIAGQAASDATVTSVQQGGFDRQSVDSAILGALFPTVGVIKDVTKLKIGSKAGGRVINSLIKPLLKDFSYGKDPGKTVAESGIVANSLDDLTVKIRAERQKVGADLAKIVDNSDKTFSAFDALKPLDEAIEEAKKSPRINKSIISRLEDTKADLLQMNEAGIPTRNLSLMTARQVLDLKQEVGDLARWTGNSSDDEITNKAVKKVYGQLKAKLDAAIPETVPLNEKYAGLKSAEIATEYRDKIASRQNLVSLPGINVGVGSALLTTIATGGSITPAIIVGAGVTGVQKALSTPAAKTRLAAWLASQSPAELQSLWKEAPWLRATLQASLFGDTEEGVQSNDDE